MKLLRMTKNMKVLMHIILWSLVLPAAQAQELWQPYYISPRAGNQHLDLATDWELTHVDDTLQNPLDLPKNDWIRVQEPTSVQMALYKAGKLPNPYEHLNAKQYEWTEKKIWYYRKKFNMPTVTSSDHIFLCFEGIDYFSKIWLNGKLLGRHKGMWGGPVIHVNRFIQAGQENEIVVEVKSANFGQWEEFKWKAPGKIIKSRTFAGGGSHKPFFALGLWKGVRVEIVPEIHMERPFLVTEQANDKEATLTLSTEIFIGRHSLQYALHPWGETQIANYTRLSRAPVNDTIDEAVSLKVEFMEAGKVAFVRDFSIYALKGRSWFEQTFTVPEPRLWYPNGLGEPHLYRVRLSLTKNGETLDNIEFDYGIRTIGQERSAGPRTGDRWKNWQFLVNDRPMFVKGVNWMPVDPLYDFTADKYEWLIAAAKNAGIQMIRIWGGGLLETSAFYDACNRHGIMVWQDFPINNNLTPDWAQDIWEAQVTHNIFRLRNQPSLAVWCGGNEFNPYAKENAATMNILERSLDDFDPTRLWLRTSPDHGSTHLYPDFDPVWYKKKMDIVPYIAETGIHSIPEAKSLYEVVSAEEFTDLGGMYQEGFAETHPEFIYHFMEYSPSRVPRMLSRASHIDDMSNPTLESIAEASQVGAGEFYQVMSEGLQGNYPVTTGLMPWVFKRPWPTVAAIHLLDGFGQPSAPYYFLKRTYEPVHVMLDIDRLLWKPGEVFPVTAKVINATATSHNGTVTVRIYNQQFQQVWEKRGKLTVKAGPVVAGISLDSFKVPAEFQSQYFFVEVAYRDNKGIQLSRSVYWPRTIAQMNDPAFSKSYISNPVEWPTLREGPWLKPIVAQKRTRLRAGIVSTGQTGEDYTRATIKISNQGEVPAFMTRIDVEGAKRTFVADDNYFWLPPGEEKEVEVIIKWRETSENKRKSIAIKAWNAKSIKLKL